MALTFYKYIDSFRLLSIYFSKKPEIVYYFNISNLARFLRDILRMKHNIQYLDFKLFSMRDNQGESYFPKIFGKDMLEVCNGIENDILRKNPFIISFGRLFGPERVLMFFKKDAHKDIQDIIIYMNVIKWHINNKGLRKPVTFSIEKTIYFDALKQFALNQFNITLISFLPFRQMLKHLLLLLRSMLIITTICFMPFQNIFKSNASRREKNKMPMLGITYIGIGASLAKTERCEFPWLIHPDIPSHQVIIYSGRKDVPFSDAALVSLKKKGIQCCTLVKNKTAPKDLDLFRPTFKAARVMLSFIFKLLLPIMKEISQHRFGSLAYLSSATSFIISYSKAYDFFYSNNIKVNITYDHYGPYHIAEQCALDALGGVSTGFQLSHWPVPNVYLGCSADIMFLFGSYYYDTLIKSGVYTQNVLSYGYFNDYSFSAVKVKAKELKDRLINNGAKFIICYFDENSSDDRMSVISNKTSKQIYERLLNWVIEDKTMGLICCPKKPLNLLQRLPDIQKSMEKAKATGRCIFMGGEYRTTCYPTEPAQASDLVITLLIGGTVALESYLSGVRSVYLDLEGLCSFPEYRTGQNKIVFDNLDVLISAINKCRYGNADNDFGNANLAVNLDDRDPFRDGLAAKRVGQYLNWLLESLNEGTKREEAIRYANQKYTGVWGKESLVRHNQHTSTKVNAECAAGAAV